LKRERQKRLESYCERRRDEEIAEVGGRQRELRARLRKRRRTAKVNREVTEVELVVGLYLSRESAAELR